MRDKLVFSVTLLDFILLLMSATWIIVTLQKSAFPDLFYNIIYVFMNIVSLLLNVKNHRSKIGGMTRKRPDKHSDQWFLTHYEYNTFKKRKWTLSTGY